MNDQDYENMADDHSGAGIPRGFVDVEIDKDLKLDIDQVGFLAGLCADHSTLFMSQPISALFVQWYALSVFVEQAPDQGLLLTEATDALEFLQHVLNDSRPGSGELLDILKAWFHDHWNEDEASDEQST